MKQNYLLGQEGIQINALLIASAWNLKKMMEKLEKNFFVSFFNYFLGKTYIHCLKIDYLKVCYNLKNMDYEINKKQK